MLVLSDRVHETPSIPALLIQFYQLVDRRLAIARKGLEEVRQSLRTNQTEDAALFVEKLDEDLLLLRRRLERDLETAAPRSSVLYGHASAAN